MEWLVGPLAGGLFDYNRENFFFDWEQRLKREFQGQNMRVKQFGLYRDDVRDLMGLTVSKMDNYLIVNAFTLGICVMLFTMGRPESGKSAQWVLWLSSMTTASAFFYTLMSMWLAMHASVAAHSFGVRMLTQAVRLPIPSKAQLDAATAVARDYESKSLADMLRVPVVRQQMQRLAAMDNVTQQNVEGGELAMSDDEASSDMESACRVQSTAAASALKHLKLYRKLQANWQAYDAYARVSMAMGANQLLHALGLYLTPGVLAVAAVLLLLPPAFTMTGIIIAQSDYAAENEVLSDICAPASFLMHIAWIYFVLHIARPTEFNGVALPTKFRSVLYLDVFGWLQAPPPDEVATRDSSATQGGPARDRGITEEGCRFQIARQESFGRAQAQAAEGMRAKLSGVCHDAEQLLQRELGYWESEEVQDMLQNDQHRLREIRRLRARLDAVARRRAVAVEAASIPLANASENVDMPATWLQLEWYSSGMPIPFWYRCETRASVWTLPQEPDRASTLGSIDSQITTFDEKVEELLNFEMKVDGVPGSLSLVDASSATLARPIGGALGASVPDPIANTLSNATEDEPFGGREAVPLDAFQQDTDNFHPHAALRPSNPRRRRRRKLAQGKLPWQTFSQGSIYMLCVWAIGLVWCTWRVLDHSIDIVTHDFVTRSVRSLSHNLGVQGSADPRLELFHGPWPHAFFKPRDIHCNDLAGSTSRLLVVETFGVHGLNLFQEENFGGDGPLLGSWAPSGLVDACLAQEPEFLSAGLRGATELCSARSSQACEVVMLAASGMRTLLCSSVTGRAMSSVATLPGGSWTSIAAMSDSLMAVRSDSGAAVTFRAASALGSVAAGWIPAFDVFLLPAVSTSSLKKVVMMGVDAALRLDADGLLQAVPLNGSSAADAVLWSRRLPRHSLWDSLCFSGIERSVFVLGHRLRNGRPLIARLRLPSKFPT